MVSYADIVIYVEPDRILETWSGEAGQGQIEIEPSDCPLILTTYYVLPSLSDF
jgi:hypothetical protein